MAHRVYLYSILMLVAAAVSVTFLVSRGVPVVARTNLENIPRNIDGFRGADDFFPQSVYRELNTDANLYRHYKSPDGGVVDLYVGYYGTAKGGRTGHNPNACLPGAGWGILKNSRMTIQSENGRKDWRVNYILAKKGLEYEVVLHWYQSSADKVLSNGIQQNFQRLFSRLLKNRDDGAFIRVSATAEAPQVAVAEKRVEFFARKILEIIPDYWPEEE